MVTRRTRYTDALLTVIAVLLGVLALGRMGEVTEPAHAASTPPGVGQPGKAGEGGGLVSAAQQRKVMIAQLKELSKRMEKIEGALNKGITVKVSEMPEIRIPREGD